MPDRGTPLCACGQPSPGAAICNTCTLALEQALRDAIALAPELDVALARMSRFTTGTPRHRHGHPLPYDPHAADAAQRLRDTLTTWAREIP